MRKSEEVFLPVLDPIAREKIFESLISLGTEMNLKGVGPNEKVLQVRVMSKKGSLLTCELLSKQKFEGGQRDFILQFDQGDQKYVAQTSVRIVSDLIELSCPESLYRVQRRDDFRLKIPESFNASLVLDGLSSKGFRVIDVSAGGLQVETPKSISLSKGQMLTGSLKTSDRDDLSMKMKVLRINEHPSNSALSLVGLQFESQSELQKNRMAALVMDLYRQFFTNHRSSP